MNYVVTGFNEAYWDQWGVSWIASLKELAQYSGNIIIVDFGLSSPTKNKLTDLGVMLLTSDNHNFRVGIFQAIVNFSKSNSGIFAIWDADVYFQQPIDEIFELAKNKLIMTNEPGFFAGPEKSFVFLENIQEMISFIKDENSFQDCVSEYFTNSFYKVDETWNFTKVSHLSEIEKQKVIHPTGEIKFLMMGKKIAFWERYKDLYEQYSSVKAHVHKRLVKKTDCTTSKNITIQQEV